ncbi:hypothetical protein GTS_27430 [Gandjariella thermophila]|uniref:Putative T7SS secretion signal domain-containing protein n=1 Tax=Gandjariella thermophila TaxID=1931992 RepID=A0A4D4J7V9_9PSEU|nr:hypothetical protein [Gandjariella thermophila]GDY31110.1 hypothetical protein GTS_27430 [Gandjariella thermophila]
MTELGQSRDPRELVPGDAATLRGTAESMTRIGEALNRVGEGLTRLDDGGWQGASAEAFRAYFDGQPAKWIACGDAFHAASEAVHGYASTLEWAQGEAQRAIGLWEQGQQAIAQVQ